MLDKLKTFITSNFFAIFYIITAFYSCFLSKHACSLFIDQAHVSVFTNFTYLFFPDKFSEIVGYILSLGILFLMFLIYPLFKNISNYQVGTNAPFALFIYATLIIIFSSIKSSNDLKILIILFFAILSVLACYRLAKGDYLKQIFLNIISNIKIKKILTNSMVILAIFMFVFQIYPFVFGKLHVINEFSDIPELTKIKGQIINSLEYENENFKNYVKTKKDKNQIDRYIEANIIEIHWKTLSRYVLYHHSHMLVPILELELNKDKTQIFAQYGLFSAKLLGTVLKHTGGINIHNYFKLYYSIFYIYYGSMFLIAYKMFKSKKTVFSLLLFTIISINIYNFYYFYLAPGCNPYRHFFDIIVIFLLYKYYNNFKIKYFISAISLALFAMLLNCNMGLFLYLAFIPAFWYKNITLKQNKNLKFELFIIAVSLAISYFIYKFSTVGADYTKEYFSQGLLGWPLSDTALIIILSTIILGYLIFSLIKNNIKLYALAHCAFYSFIYIQGLLLYFIWGSDTKHFVVITPVIAFVLLMIFKLAENIFLENKYDRFKKMAVNIIIVVLFAISCIGFTRYVKDYYCFKSIFKKHITYDWNFKNAKFKSTIDPKYFDDSIDLLKKYSYDNNGVYIISKYDYFIPFLADKYNLMPYINLEWYVLSQKEVQTSIDLIKNKKPTILFADKNIMYANSSCYSVYNKKLAYLNLECQAHKDRITTVSKIFDAVKSDYYLIDSSYLLNVYKRK